MPIPAPPPAPTTYVNDWTGVLNGLPIGPGTPYEIKEVNGWRSMTSKPLGGVMTGSSSSMLPAPKGFTNGSWSIPYWMERREVEIIFGMMAGGADWETTVQAFEAATQPTGEDTASLTLELGGISSTITGAVEDRDIPTDLEYQFGMTFASVKFIAFDPRRLMTNISGTTLPPAVSGGLTIPFTIPFSITSTIVSGEVSLTNQGNANGPVTVTLTGPITGPFVTHQQTGLTVAFSSSFTINAGDTLTIDMENQTVLYNGTASRSADVITRGWFSFPKGANTYALGCTSSGVGASMTVTASPAFI